MTQLGAQLVTWQPHTAEQVTRPVESWPDTQEDLARMLTMQPDVAEVYVQRPDTRANLHTFTAATAALQRDALITGDPSRLRRNRLAIHDGFANTGYWQTTLRSVARGNPSAVDLQLVTWSLDGQRPDLRVIQPGLPSIVARKTHVDQFVPHRAWEDRSANDAWRAVQAYVRQSPYWRQHFNAPQGHLLATAQVGLMREMGLFKDMDLTVANPLLRAMTEQGRRFVELAREGGHVHLLPHDVRWTIRALEQFDQDRVTRARGNRTIERVQGRTWRFLAQPEAERSFEQYLGGRVEMRDVSNQQFREWYTTPSAVLRAQLHRWIKTAQSDSVTVNRGGAEIIHSADDVVESMQATTYNTYATEMVGTLWGVLTMRRREPAVSALIDEAHMMTKRVLEPYVIDGQHLVGSWQGAHWLPVVTLHSWADKDRRVSVFTPDGKSILEDRREAGAALSDQIRMRTGQDPYNEDGSISHGYEPLRPHVGMCIALYHALDVAAAKEVPTAMRIDAYRDFIAMVDSVPRHERSKVYTGLPDDVQQFIDHRGYLAQRLGVG